LGLLVLASAFTLFMINFMSESGKFHRDYFTSLYAWNRDKVSERLAPMQLSYKTLPYLDASKNVDHNAMEHRSLASEADRKIMET